MTIRDGGRPRVDRADPYAVEPDPYDATTWPGRDRRTATVGRRRRRGGGPSGVVRFLIFAVVLAAAVLIAAVTILRPIVRGAIVGWAGDNPAALGLPFVADLVREDLGSNLDSAPTTDATEAPFTINNGDTARTIAQRLHAQGFLTDARSFVFIAIERGVSTKFNSGDYILRRNMTPAQLVALLEVPPANPYVDVGLREGLRLEQITAKLETLPLTMDVRKFYDLAKHPPASLIAEHPWLDALKLPPGTSLEGFLYPATYSILPDATPEELISLMLDKFEQQVGDRMKVPRARGLTFYQVLTLASIVEHEAVLDEERPIIAGVYQNRLNSRGAIRILNADPVVFYALDSVALAKLEFGQWQQYVFWRPPGVGLSGVTLPRDLAGYQSYRVAGLPPGPICTPSLASIDAALAPDTKAGFKFFVAIPNGGGRHDFSKTFAEHQEKLRKYGYTSSGG
jgi:UPF0755 protein